MSTYTPQQLTEKNGENGRQALVAVDGTVYDVSASVRWKNGVHMNRHKAGSDLSVDIKGAPHGLEVLGRFQSVGTLLQEEAERPAGLRGSVLAWVDKHPFFERHPHPAVVHLPVGLMVATPLFEGVALALGSPATEWAAFCTLLLAVVSLPAAIATGYFTWWLNYECRESSTIRWKRRLAWTAVIVGIAAILVRLSVPDPLALSDPLMLAYLALFAGVVVLVSVVGFLGGTLTFPLR